MAIDLARLATKWTPARGYAQMVPVRSVEKAFNLADALANTTPTPQEANMVLALCSRDPRLIYSRFPPPRHGTVSSEWKRFSGTWDRVWACFRASQFWQQMPGSVGIPEVDWAERWLHELAGMDPVSDTATPCATSAHFVRCMAVLTVQLECIRRIAIDHRVWRQHDLIQTALDGLLGLVRRYGSPGEVALRSGSALEERKQRRYSGHRAMAPSGRGGTWR